MNLPLRKICRYFVLSLLYLILTGCSTTRSGHNWGENATISPGWEQVGKSASDAALQAETWVPFATALLIAVTGADSKIQDWAYRNTPLFGSVSNAKNISDDLLKVSTWIYLTSVIITPSGDELPGWLLNKTKGLAVGVSAIVPTQLLTSEIKTLSGRQRPDSSDSRSFPSGHTSAVAVNTMLTSRNIEYLALDPWAESSLKIGLNTMTLATAWARIEGNAHYPTDVLFGAALGNFLGAFINDTFLGRYSNNIKLTTSLSKYHRSVKLSFHF